MVNTGGKMDQRLISFIKNQLEKGGSQEVIKNKLLQKGWKETDINNVFVSLSGPPKQPQLVQPDLIAAKPKMSVYILIIVVIVVGVIFLLAYLFRGEKMPQESVAPTPYSAPVSQNSSIEENNLSNSQNATDAQVKSIVSALAAPAIFCRDGGGVLQTGSSGGTGPLGKDIYTGAVVAGKNICSKTDAAQAVWPELPAGFPNSIYLDEGNIEGWSFFVELLTGKSFICTSNGCK